MLQQDDGWPKLPIRPQDLPLIRQLMTEEEYASLVARLVKESPEGSRHLGALNAPSDRLSNNGWRLDETPKSC